MIKRLALVALISHSAMLLSSESFAARYKVEDPMPPSPARAPLQIGETDYEMKSKLLGYAREGKFKTIISYVSKHFKQHPKLIYACDTNSGDTIFDIFISKYIKKDPNAEKEHFKDLLKRVDAFSEILVSIHQKVQTIPELFSILDEVMQKRRDQRAARSEAQARRLAAEEKAKIKAAEEEKLRLRAQKKTEEARKAQEEAETIHRRAERTKKLEEVAQKLAAAREKAAQVAKKAEDAVLRAKEKATELQEAQAQVTLQTEKQQEEEEKAHIQKAKRAKKTVLSKAKEKTETKEKKSPSAETPKEPVHSESIGLGGVGKFGIAAGTLLAIIAAGKRYMDRQSGQELHERNKLSEHVDRAQ